MIDPKWIYENDWYLWVASDQKVFFSVTASLDPTQQTWASSSLAVKRLKCRWLFIVLSLLTRRRVLVNLDSSDKSY